VIDPHPRNPLHAVAAAALLAACGAPPAQVQSPATAEVEVRAVRSELAAVGVSRPLRDLPASPPSASPRVFPLRRLAKPVALPSAGPVAAPVAAPDTARAKAPAVLVAAPISGPLASFDGLGSSFPGFVIDGVPPDPNGDVGPNDYVQAVNESIAVFGKDGTHRAGPISIQSIFGPLQGTCATAGQGDPVVLYDRLADRWFLSQFAWPSDSSGNPNGPSYQCVAVSQGPDPTGAWYLYSMGPMTFQGAAAFNDYSKFGVWPDADAQGGSKGGAYYATYNMFDAAATNFLGISVCGMDRARMLAGQPASQVCLDLTSQVRFLNTLLPAHATGTTPPPTGSAELVLGLDLFNGQLDLWRVRVDLQNPAASTIDAAPIAYDVDAFQLACPTIPGTECVVQPPNPAFVPPTSPGTTPSTGPTALLDTLGDRLMHRATYRNYDGIESLVVNHAIDANGLADADDATAVRWYELRNGAGTMGSAPPVLYRQAAIDGGLDGQFRWMGSAAQDLSGDVAIGYSIAGPGTFPSIAVAGYLVTDTAPGAPSVSEAFLYGPGSSLVGAQTGRQKSGAWESITRWGDYTALSVDPADDCTFWYTNQYQPPGFGSFNWRTRIASFQLPGCGVTPTQLAIGVPATAIDGEALPVVVTAAPTFSGTLRLTSDDPLATFAPSDVELMDGVLTAPATVTLRTPGTRRVSAVDLSNLANVAPATVLVQAQTTTGGPKSSGCGCGSGGAPADLALLALAALLRRRGSRGVGPGSRPA